MIFIVNCKNRSLICMKRGIPKLIRTMMSKTFEVYLQMKSDWPG